MSLIQRKNISTGSKIIYFMSQIPTEEVDQIIKEIKAGATNYSLGKKYKHSANTIQSIREKVFFIPTEDIKEKETFLVAEEAAAAPTSELNTEDKRIVEKAKDIINEENEIIDEAKNILKEKKEKEIIDRFWENAVIPKFNDRSFLEKRTHEEEIEKLERKYIKEIEGINTKHNEEIKQIRFNHQNDFEDGYNNGKQEWDFIYCRGCNRVIPIEILEQMNILCHDCLCRQQDQKISDDLMLHAIVNANH